MLRSYSKEITVPADLVYLPAVTGLIDSMLDLLLCPAKQKVHVKIAVDEIFSNIVKHIDISRGEKVTIFVRTEPGAIEITFKDRCGPFNPLLASEPDVTAPAKKRRVGGLGLFMVKRMMDDVRYEYREEQNILTVRKEIQETEEKNEDGI